MKKIFTKLALMAVALLMGGANSAWAKTVTEVYDFATWGTANLNSNSYATITKASTASFTVNGASLFNVISFTGTKTETVWTLLTERIAISEGVTYRLPSGKNDKPRLGNEAASGAKYISITNLSAGDKVTFGSVSGFKFFSENATANGEAIVKDAAVTSDVEYIMTADGHLDIYCDSRAWASFQKLTVVCEIPDVEMIKTFEFNFESLTSHSETTVAGQTNVNKVGCQAYSIASDAIDGITINGSHLWKITANKSYGIFGRTGKATITYNGYFPAGSVIKYTTMTEGDKESETKTIEVAQYQGVTNMSVYIPKPAPLELTLNANDFGTFSAAYNTKIEGAKVYTAKLAGEKIVATLVESGIVPAANGVILVKDGETVTATYTAEMANDAAYGANDLVATTKADGSLATIQNTALVLSGNTFKTYTGSALVANKAYFEYTGSGESAKTLTIIFNNDEATGINAAETLNVAGSKKVMINNTFVIIKGNKKYNAVGCEMK